MKRGREILVKNSGARERWNGRVKNKIWLSPFLHLEQMIVIGLRIGLALPGPERAINHSWGRVRVQGGRGACGQPIQNWFGFAAGTEMETMRNIAVLPVLMQVISYEFFLIYLSIYLSIYFFPPEPYYPCMCD